MRSVYLYSCHLRRSVATEITPTLKVLLKDGAKGCTILSTKTYHISILWPDSNSVRSLATYPCELMRLKIICILISEVQLKGQSLPTQEGAEYFGIAIALFMARNVCAGQTLDKRKRHLSPQVRLRLYLFFSTGCLLSSTLSVKHIILYVYLDFKCGFILSTIICRSSDWGDRFLKNTF